MSFLCWFMLAQTNALTPCPLRQSTMSTSHIWEVARWSNRRLGGIEFYEGSTLRMPADRTHNLAQLDPDVKQWFQAQGEQYKTLINNVCRC